MNESEIMYFNENDLIESGLNNYSQIVEDVKCALIDHSKKLTLSKKIAIDLSYGHKIDSLISVNGDYTSCKWLGANVKNKELGFQRSFPLLFLNDKATGKPLSIMEGSLISALRTGAYVALAIEFLAKDNIDVVFLGSGVIAKSAAACILSYKPARDKIRSLSVYSRNNYNMESFAKNVKENFNFDVKLVKNLDLVLSKADVSVSVNTTNNILVNMDNVLKSSTHIHLGGQDDDLDYIAYCAKYGKIVCDDWEFVKKRNIQNLVFAYNQKKILERDIFADFGEIITGNKLGREADEPIYFNAVGLPVLDLYVAKRLYKQALDKGNIGLKLKLRNKKHWILGG